MGDRLTVHRPGAYVTHVPSRVEDARVLRVSIAGDGHVTYEIAWCVGADRKTAWVEAWELGDGADRPKVRIGFGG